MVPFAERKQHNHDDISGGSTDVKDEQRRDGTCSILKVDVDYLGRMWEQQ